MYYNGNGLSAVVNFLIQYEGSNVSQEIRDQIQNGEHAGYNAIADFVFKNNKLFELSKNTHPTHTLKIEGTDISVSFQKKDGETKYTNANQWIVSPAKGERFVYEDTGSNIRSRLRGKMIAVARNRHGHDEREKAGDWLVSIAFFFYITQQDDRLCTFLSFLAEEYDIILNKDASVLTDAIHLIVTMKEEELCIKRKTAVYSSIPLFVQAERAKKVHYKISEPQTIALFANNLDKFTVRKAAIRFIEEIEHTSAQYGYTKTFDEILTEKIKTENNTLDRSVLEGIQLARTKDRVFDEKTDVKPIALLNPNVDAYFYEIIKCVAAFSSMNNASAKFDFLKKLKEYAKDFSVTRRLAQERAVLSLFYILHECFEMTLEQRREIFKVVCGKLTYALIDRLFDSVNAQSNKFYKNIVSTAYNHAVNQGASPLYFFYYHKVIDLGTDRFVYTCHQFRADTRDGSEEIDAYIRTAENISNVLDDMETDGNRKYLDDKKYLYAMQSYFYGLANISLLSEEGKQQVAKLVEENPKILYRSIVVDYLTRKQVFGGRTGEALADFIRSGDFFLLCGPTRLACCLEESIPKVSIDEIFTDYGIKKNTLISDYQNFLTTEEGRYKILLAKLLSVIDNFDYRDPTSHKHCLLNCRFFNESDFLPYDNVDALKVNEKLISIKKQYLK